VRRGTYSIVARDPGTGALGVAVQSHWFCVGGVVSWAEPGAGAVATQSLAERSYGPNGLSLMRRGASAADALTRLLDDDAESEVRQVAFVDSAGRVAVHTGGGCIEHAEHHAGDGYSCQANIMARPGVPAAMAQAYESASGPLDERLLAALDAAEAAGGDLRGRQSAVLLTVPGSGEAWRRTVDLRVDDHPDPLAELRRLHTLHRAYELSERAEELTAEGRHADAAPLYEQAAQLAPDSDELLFFAGLAAAVAGDLDLALDRVRRAMAVNPGWSELLPRLGPDIAPGAAEVHRLLSPAAGDDSDEGFPPGRSTNG
jgi:uncharacterized Ntn-hydrolase superfamily protein